MPKISWIRQGRRRSWSDEPPFVLDWSIASLSIYLDPTSFLLLLGEKREEKGTVPSRRTHAEREGEVTS